VAGEALPSALRPYIHEIYEETIPVPPGQAFRLPVAATTDPILDVEFAGTFVAHAADRLGIPPFTPPRVFLSGPQPEAYAVVVGATLQGFYVRFTTVGPLALLSVRDYGLSARGIPPLHEVVRPAKAAEARRYEAALLAPPDPASSPEQTFEARVALTCAFLLAGLPDGPHAEVAFLQRALDEIEREGGNVRVDALAGRTGVAVNTLRRRFGVLGMPPKRFCEVVRFRRAHAFLHATPGATWADAVERCGYADQAHFVREYHRLAGVPPTRWRPEERSVDLRMGLEGEAGIAGLMEQEAAPETARAAAS
jgi:AraC-like DNA-binding protein